MSIIIFLGFSSLARAVDDTKLQPIDGIREAGKPRGPVRRVFIKKNACSLHMGIPVWRAQFKVLEEEYNRDGQIVLRTRWNSEQRQTNYTTNQYVYDSVGRLIEDIYNTDAFYRAYIARNTYDVRGYLAETVYLNAMNELSSRRLYDYDSSGRRVTERLFKDDGSDVLTIRSIYPDEKADKPSTSERFDENGRLRFRTKLTYTPKGDLLTSTTESDLGFFQNSTTHTYNADGRIVLTVKKTRHQKNIMVFDIHGNVIHEVLYDKDGTFVERTVRFYTYDKYGNWTHCLDLRSKPISQGLFILVPCEFSVKQINYHEPPTTAAPPKNGE